MDPFIGREEEIQHIARLLNRSQQAGLQMVLLTGPSGVGKTRLLQELQRHFGDHAFALSFQGDLHADHFFEQLGERYPEFLVHLPRYCPMEDLQAVTSHYPFLRPYLPIEPSETSPSRPVSTASILFPCLQALTKTRPLLLLLDDFGPPAEAPALQHLLLHLEHSPLVVVVVTSQEEAWLSWSPHQIHLRPFTQEETLRFLTSRGHSPSPKALQQWQEVTQGLPLFLHLAVQAWPRPPQQGITAWIQQRFQRFPRRAQHLYALFHFLREPLVRSHLARILPRGTLQGALPVLLRSGFLHEHQGHLHPPHAGIRAALAPLNLDQNPAFLSWLRRTVEPRLLRWPPLWHLPWYRVPLSWTRSPRMAKASWGRFLLQQAQNAQRDHYPQRALQLLQILNQETLPHQLQEEAWYQEAQMWMHTDPQAQRLPTLLQHLQERAPKRAMKLLAIRFSHLAIQRHFQEARAVLERIREIAQTPWQRAYAHRLHLGLQAMVQKDPEPAFRALRQLIQTTPFADQRIAAFTDLVVLETCAHQTAQALQDCLWFFQAYPDLPPTPVLLPVLVVVYSLSGRLKEARRFLDELEKTSQFSYFGELFNVHYAHLTLLAHEGDHAQFQRLFPRMLEQAQRTETPAYINSLAVLGLQYFRELDHLEEHQRLLRLLSASPLSSCWRLEEEQFHREVEEAWNLWRQGQREQALRRVQALASRSTIAASPLLALLERLQGLIYWEQGDKATALRVWQQMVQRLKTGNHRIHLLWAYRFLSRITGQDRFQRAWRSLALETGAVGWYGDPQSMFQLALERGQRIHIRTLGTQEIHLPGTATPLGPTAFRYRRAWTLLALLLIHGSPQRGVSRKDLLARIWPEARTSNPLDIVLSHLRKHTVPDLWITEAGRLRLNLDLAEVDALEFLHRARRGLTASSEEDTGSLLEQAVHLYQGPFMPQVDHPEVETFRQYLARLHRDARIKLASLALHRAAPREAYSHAYHLLIQDPYDEDAHRLIMLSFWLQGNRGGALRQYDRLQHLLQREFGMQPSQELQQLAHRIRTGAPPDLLAG